MFSVSRSCTHCYFYATFYLELQVVQFVCLFTLISKVDFYSMFCAYADQRWIMPEPDGHESKKFSWVMPSKTLRPCAWLHRGYVAEPISDLQMVSADTVVQFIADIQHLDAALCSSLKQHKCCSSKNYHPILWGRGQSDKLLIAQKQQDISSCCLRMLPTM